MAVEKYTNNSKYLGLYRVEKDTPYQMQTGEKRTCPLCGKEFATKKGVGQFRRQFCYDCLPEASGSATITLRKSLKKHLLEYKGGKCECCGYDKSATALQFHHTHPEEKEFEITRVNVTMNIDMDRIHKEVDKCILLCANCHFELHEQEGCAVSPREKHRPNYKAVINVDTGEEFCSAAEAGRQTGIHPDCIGACCRGRTKTAGGQIWKFKELQQDQSELSRL